MTMIASLLGIWLTLMIWAAISEAADWHGITIIEYLKKMYKSFRG